MGAKDGGEKIADIMNDIFEINHRLSFNLWYLTDVKSNPQGLSPRLIFPKWRSGEIRISEQESKILYCGLLNTLNYYYSIETPTEEVYQQSGKTSQSASSDLSLYEYDGKDFKKVANVEFKAHNPDKEQIRKDIEKIIKEGITGNWFHTLKNIDGGTLPSLFKKFIYSFKECSSLIDADKGVSMLFCFCVLDKKWACIKHFLYDSSKASFENYLDNFFSLDYFVKSGKIEVIDGKGWSLISLAD
jgi:hypothetical protein